MKKMLALLLVGGLLSLTTGCPGSTPPKPAAGPKGPSNTGGSSKADKIVGKWTFEKSVGKDGKPGKEAPPEGTVFEFTKEGDLKMTMKDPMGKKDLTMSGTYKVDGDKITTAFKPPVPNAPEKKETATITSLTDTELSIKDDKGETTTFKKK